jgi:VWFA-related protein
MKHCFIAILFLAFVSSSFGQKSSVSPTLEKTRTKTFGSSLDKYKNKKQKSKKSPDSQQKQKSGEPDDEEVIRIETDLVVSDVLVTDQKSKVIVNLKKDDFIVTEDGVPQTVEIFSPGASATIPRSIVLIIDCTMPQAPYVKNSIAAAKILVDKLNPNDKMAIVTNYLNLQLDFTQDKTLLKKTLDSLEKQALDIPGGGDFNTMLAVLNEMFDEENRQRIIIFQSDGSGIMWLKPDKEHPYPVSYATRYNSGMKWIGEEKAMLKFGFSEVKEAIERSQATIYSIIPGIRFLGFSEKEQLARAKITLTDLNKSFGWKVPTTIERQYTEAETKAAGQTAMFRVAELSGGNAGFIEKPEDAENIYSEIFTIIKNRYVIGYYPSNQNRDGKRRNVKIEVRNHPEYVVTGRKAYFAPENDK